MATPTDGRVAIVSAALRLPGANDLETFRRSLVSGVDSIRRHHAGVPAGHEVPLGLPGNARFVAAYGSVDSPLAFDHERFGIPASEALMTDPQQRLLLELADEALHTAAITAHDRRATAVFVGAGLNSYQDEVRHRLAGMPGVDDFGVELATARDYLAGKVAYRLDLRGPAVTVLAACATGLVAVHLGRHALLSGEADVALAGAAAVRYPLQTGYWAVPGTISASDGVCRPFDARAAGTVPADGAAVVVMRRLDDALAAGDTVLAVICGSAVGNDGRKPGFAGVDASAQRQVIERALANASLSPAAIRYIESHGTGTRLGDAVEWSALQRIFGRNEEPVLVGALKGHIGHTREAAGLAGLLKGVLAVAHGEVAPTTNFSNLPSDLAMCDSPLSPVTARTSLTLPAGAAVGVSAFGLGGYNCHLVLEPPPVAHDAWPSPTSRSTVVLLSSHREDTLEVDTERVHRWMELDQPDFSALAGRSQRRAHPHGWRRWVETAGSAAPTAPPSPGALARRTRRVSRRPRPVAFAFPGLGSDYPGMAAGLVASSEVFAASLQQTARSAADVGVDIATMTKPLPPPVERLDLVRLVARTAPAAPSTDLAVRHLALHAVQLAFVDLLADAGVTPSAVVGHSLGEWTAATVAGAINRADVCRLIARRAQLVEGAEPGATIAVAESAHAVRQIGLLGFEVAAENSPQSCTVSGPVEAAAQVELRLAEAGIVFHRLNTRTAFHSSGLLPASRQLGREIATHRWETLALPMVSTVSGSWLTAEQIGPAYWCDQLVRPVLFRQAVSAITEQCGIVLEIGPGNTRPWVTQTVPEVEAVRTSRTVYESVDDRTLYEHALAELWLNGHDPQWLIGALAPLGSVDEAPALVRRVLDPRSSESDLIEARAAVATPPVPASKPQATRSESTTSSDFASELAALWCALLGVSEVSPDDHFFDLGGDSLLGRHLIALIQDLTGDEVPSSVIFADGSLQGMTESVRRWLDGRGLA